MSDRNAGNGEDMMNILADDLCHYEFLTAEETEAVIQEVEGHSVLPNLGRFAPNRFLP